MNEFAGQVVVVTGASRGIGAAVARHFGRHGARVALLARGTGALEQVADEVRNNGGEALVAAADVARYDHVAAAVERALDAWGRIDVLVNNAGLIEPIARLADVDPGAWGEVIDVNVKGVFHGYRAVLPAMLEAGRGVIVNLSSGAATSALEGWSHYCASKAAVLMLTRCAHREVGDRGIRVVGLSPGTVATDMQDAIRESGINPVSQLDPEVHIPPEWVARAVAWLCGPGGAEHAGGDFSLKDDAGRGAVGLPPLGS